MRTLIPLLLWLSGCGTVETAPTPVPSIDTRIEVIVTDAIKTYADAGHSVTINYPIMVVTDIPENPQTIAVCDIYPDNTRAIRVKQWYLDTQSKVWLRKLLVHEICHCSFGYLDHVDEGSSQVMSAYSRVYDDTLAPDAWENFWLLITQLENKTRWFGL